MLVEIRHLSIIMIFTNIVLNLLRCPVFYNALYLKSKPLSMVVVPPIHNINDNLTEETRTNLSAMV